MFLGNSLATRVLVEIGSAEPARRNAIPALAALSASGAEGLLRKMAIAGLIGRWTTAERWNVFDYRLAREGPLTPAVRRVLTAVGAANAVRIGPPAPIPEGSCLVDAPTTPRQFPKRGAQGSPLTWLGSPLRTLAVILVAQLEEVDESSVARGCGVKTQHEMLALLRPMERDGLFTATTVGPFRVYRLAETPWREALRALCSAIADFDGTVGATVAATRQVRTGGTHHTRAFLGRYLRDGVPSYKSPGRRRGDGE